MEIGLGVPLDFGTALQVSAFLAALPEVKDDGLRIAIVRATIAAHHLPRDAELELSWILDLVRGAAAMGAKQ